MINIQLKYVGRHDSLVNNVAAHCNGTHRQRPVYQRLYIIPCILSYDFNKLTVIPAVRLTCIARFWTISQSILNRFLSQFSTDFYETLQELFSSHATTTVKFSFSSECLVKKLDHLACNTIQGKNKL